MVLGTELASLYQQQQHLNSLMDARQKLYSANQQQTVDEQKKAQNLAGKAQTLKELIDGMELNV